MATTVTLSSHISDHLNELVAAGRYASTDEAADELLTLLLDDSEPVYSAQELIELRAAAEEAERGEFVPQEEVAAFFDDWRRNG